MDLESESLFYRTSDSGNAIAGLYSNEGNTSASNLQSELDKLDSYIYSDGDVISDTRTVSEEYGLWKSRMCNLRILGKKLPIYSSRECVENDMDRSNVVALNTDRYDETCEQRRLLLYKVVNKLLDKLVPVVISRMEEHGSLLKENELNEGIGESISSSHCESRNFEANFDGSLCSLWQREINRKPSVSQTCRFPSLRATSKCKNPLLVPPSKVLLSDIASNSYSQETGHSSLKRENTTRRVASQPKYGDNRSPGKRGNVTILKSCLHVYNFSDVTELPPIEGIKKHPVVRNNAVTSRSTSARYKEKLNSDVDVLRPITSFTLKTEQKQKYQHQQELPVIGTRYTSAKWKDTNLVHL